MDDELPPTMTGRHPAPAERIVLADGDAEDPLTNIQVLLLGARRANELTVRRARCSSGTAQRDP